MTYQSRYTIAGQTGTFASAASRRRSFRERVVARLNLWRERIVVRRHLATMDARSLRDAGISPAAAACESGKPFWQPMGPLR